MVPRRQLKWLRKWKKISDKNRCLVVRSSNGEGEKREQSSLPAPLNVCFAETLLRISKSNIYVHEQTTSCKKPYENNSCQCKSWVTAEHEILATSITSFLNMTSKFWKFCDLDIS